MTSLARRSRAAIAAFSLLIATGVASAQQPIVMKFGTQTLNDVQHEYMKEYKIALEKATNSRIRVDIFPASQLGPFPRQIEGLRLGNIEAINAPFEFYAGIDPIFQVTAMNGLFKDKHHMRRVVQNDAFRKVFEEVGEKKGVIVASFIASDMQTFALRSPAASLADLKGRRLRVLASEAEQDAVRSIGAAPIPMPLPEVLPALQQGTIDGTSGVITNYVALRYSDAAPNMLDTGLWGVLVGVLVSKEWHSKLPPDLQKAVIDTAKAVEPANFKWLLMRHEQDAKAWAASGGKVVRLPPADQAEAEKLVADSTQKVLSKYPALKTAYEKARGIARTVD